MPSNFNLRNVTVEMFLILCILYVLGIMSWIKAVGISGGFSTKKLIHLNIVQIEEWRETCTRKGVLKRLNKAVDSSLFFKRVNIPLNIVHTIDDVTCDITCLQKSHRAWTSCRQDLYTA